MTQETPAETELAALRSENADLKAELAESRRAQAWIESRVADLDFEVRSLRTRLQESQEIRRELERCLTRPTNGG